MKEGIKLIYKIRYVFLFLAVMLVDVAHADSGFPRMWEAERRSDPATKFYILGATHFGLPIEYDRYFDEVVVPFFKQSRVLHFEGAGNNSIEPYPKCDSSILDETGRNELGVSRAKTLALAVKLNNEIHKRSLLLGIDDKKSDEQRYEIQKSFVGSLDEFGLIEVYNSYLATWEAMSEELASLSNSTLIENSKKNSVRETTIQGSVVEHLIRLNPKIEKKDLDTKYGVRRAYCLAGSNRIEYLKSMFNQQKSTNIDFLKKIPMMESSFSAMLIKNQSNSSQSVFDELSDLDSTFICGRTEDWIKKLKTIHDKNAYFIVAGARHINDIHTDKLNCPGLLNYFVQEGFEVKLLK